MKKMGFIGAGNMARAIIKGIANSGLAGGLELFVYDINPDALDKYRNGDIIIADSASCIAEKCDIIFLAVKPQNFQTALDNIKDNANRNAVYVSIAAAISTSYICEKLGFDAKVVRVMPNTPFLIGEGASAICRGSFVNDDEFMSICKVIETGGIYEIFEEEHMNSIIAVNGSSPAFIYYFTKGFMDYAVGCGMDYEKSLRLFCQTITGSLKMMTDSGMSIDDLIKAVSSPGGTTVAGLSVFKEKNLVDTTVEACRKCYDRAEELGL